MKSHELTKERLLAEIAERTRVEEQLRAANRTLRTINRCNEALVRATEEIELVEAICRILVEDGGIRMAWVGYRGENAAWRRFAHAGFDDGYLDSIELGLADAATAQGPTAVAIQTGEPYSTDDIATDPRFRRWRDEALRRGYGSSLALPLKSDEGAFGALTLYADRPHSFDEQTRSHFTELANDLAYGITALRTRADRARVEAELRRIEAYLEEGQRLTHTGSWAWNVASRENVYWSPEQYRIFGLDAVEDANAFEKALRRILPEDRANFIEILDSAIREKKDFDVEWRIPLSDGSLRYHHSVGHPVLDKDGEVVEYVGTLVDVTDQYLARMALERENAERRRAEEELRRSEAFLAEGQRISQTGSWAWNVTTGEVSWSAEHFRIFGLDPDATTPSYAAFADRIHPEDRAAFEDMLEKAVRDGSNFEYGFRIVTPDGATKYLHSLGHLRQRRQEHRIYRHDHGCYRAPARRGSPARRSGRSRAGVAAEHDGPAHGIDRARGQSTARRNHHQRGRLPPLARRGPAESRGSAAGRDAHREKRPPRSRHHQERPRPHPEVDAGDGPARHQRRDPGGDRPHGRRVPPPWRPGRNLAARQYRLRSSAIGCSFSRS